jgi:hypothetical protein
MTKELYFNLVKADALKRIITLTAATEELDKVGEIFDYKTSKPYFKKWSEDTYKRSEVAVKTFGEKAANYGNVREMHVKVAAGKIAAPLAFNDSKKSIKAQVKVTDDSTWQKVEDGILTGASIGGDYIKCWEDSTIKLDDDKPAIRYTASPIELSLVDSPCMPSSTFSFIRSDGVQELRKFTSIKLDKEAATQKAYNLSVALSKNENVHSEVHKFIKSAKQSNINIDTFLKSYISVFGKNLKLDKSLYDVSTLGSVISSLNYCMQSLEYEAQNEGDDSPIPADLKEILRSLIAVYIDTAKEEAEELLSDDKSTVKLENGKDKSVKKFLETHKTAIAKAAESDNADIKAMALALQKAGDMKEADKADMKDEDEEDEEDDSKDKPKDKKKSDKVYEEIQLLKTSVSALADSIKEMGKASEVPASKTPTPALNGNGVTKDADSLKAPEGFKIDSTDPKAALKVIKLIQSGKFD